MADSHGREGRGQRTASELIGRCQTMLAEHLEAMVLPAVEQTRESMLDAAERAGSTEEQGRLVSAFNLLRRQQTDVSATIADSVLQTFEVWLGRKEDDGPGASAEDGEEAAGLSLVAEEELDEELTVNQMVHRLELRFTVELHALRRRLAVLSGGKPVDDESNPLGPRRVGRILRKAVAPLPLEPTDKVMLLEQFDQLVRERIGDLYQGINEMLIEAGILPNIRYEFERRQAPSPESSPATSEDEAMDGEAPGAPEAPYAPHPPHPPHASHASQPPMGRRAPGSPAVQRADHLTREVHAESAQLMSRISELLDRMHANAPPVPVERQVAPEDMGAALRDLQSQYQPDRGESLDADSIKRRLSTMLAKRGKEIGPDQNKTIDLMGMVYDYLRDELAVIDQVKTLFEKLQLPLLRVAISDGDFFEKDTHPAREFFNTLSEAGDLWMGDHPEGSDMLARLTTAVNDVAEGEGEDLDRFSDRLEEIRRHISLSARKAQLSERRQVQARKGQEKLRIARAQAVEIGRKLVEKYDPPEFARNLIEEAWADYLALIHLRHGDESPEWQHAVATIRFVAMGLKGRLAPTMADQLRQRLPGMAEDLVEGLCQVGFSGPEAESAVERITEGIEWALQHEPGDEPPEEMAEPIPEPVARENKPKEPPPTTLASEEAKLSPGEREALAKLRLLAFGSYLELEDEQSNWIKRKLSWFSPVTGHCLLTDSQGRAEEMSLVDLAKKMHAGTARPHERPAKPLLDRALDAVFTRLRRLTGDESPA